MPCSIIGSWDLSLRIMIFVYICCLPLNPRAPNATYMLQEIHMHIAIHILNKILQYVCVGILHIQLDLYTEKKLLFNIISLSRMTEHISKSELFCNKRNTVKSSTLHQNITILEMSCEYQKNMRI